jgi:hypothetical protein
VKLAAPSLSIPFCPGRIRPTASDPSASASRTTTDPGSLFAHRSATAKAASPSAQPLDPTLTTGTFFKLGSSQLADLRREPVALRTPSGQTSSRAFTGRASCGPAGPAQENSSVVSKPPPPGASSSARAPTRSNHRRQATREAADRLWRARTRGLTLSLAAGTRPMLGPRRSLFRR